jgi:hypothetical protein
VTTGLLVTPRKAARAIRQAEAAVLQGLADKTDREILNPEVAAGALRRVAELEADAARLRGQVAELHRKLGMATGTITSLRQTLEPQYKAFQRLFADLEDHAAADGGFDRAPFEAWMPKLRKGGRAILETLLDRGPELSIRQLMVLTQRRDGGGWRADIGQLRSVGLVEPGDPVKLRVP